MKSAYVVLSLLVLTPLALCSCGQQAGLVADVSFLPRIDAGGQRDAATPHAADSGGLSDAATPTPPDATPADAGELACDIAGVQYSVNSPNPLNSCQVCVPNTSTNAWTNLPDGSACAANRLCVSGFCTTSCQIGGIFYSEGAIAPSNPCLNCQPALSSSSWSSVVDGASCGNGFACRSGACNSSLVVAFERIVNGQTDLFVVPESGGTPVVLADSPDSERYLGHLGDRVLYSRYVYSLDPSGGNYYHTDIYSVRLDGSGRIGLGAISNANASLVGFLDGYAIIRREWCSGVDPFVPDEVYAVKLDGTSITSLAKGAISATSQVTTQILGNRVVLSSDAGLESCYADGSSRTRISADGGFVWFRSGERIVYSNFSGQLFASNIDGTGQVSLGPADGSGTGNFEPVQLAGDRIIFHTYQTSPQPLRTLKSVLLDGSGLVVLGSAARLDPFGSLGSWIPAVQWSASGSYLFSYAADGSASHSLGADDFVAMTSDRFVGIRNRGSSSAPIYDLVSSRPDGSSNGTVSLDVVPDSSIATQGPIHVAAFPLNNRLIFRKQIAGQIEIQSVVEDGTSLVTLSQGGGDKTVEGLDGTKVVYRNSVGSQGNLWCVESDASYSVPLATTLDDEQTARVVHGRLFFYRLNSGKKALYRVALDGSGTAMLSNYSDDLLFADAFY